MDFKIIKSQIISRETFLIRLGSNDHQFHCHFVWLYRRMQ